MMIYVKALFYISDFDDEQFTKVINKSHNLVTLPERAQLDRPSSGIYTAHCDLETAQKND